MNKNRMIELLEQAQENIDDLAFMNMYLFVIQDDAKEGDPMYNNLGVTVRNNDNTIEKLGLIIDEIKQEIESL